MAEHPVPPPHEPPLADEAPPHLVAFLYYMIRDLIPPRYVNSVVAHTRGHSYPELGAMDKGLVDYADRVARELVYGYTPTEDA